MSSERSRLPVYLDSSLVRAVRTLAARSGRSDTEIVEDALRSYLGAPGDGAGQSLREMLDGRAEVADDEALSLAYAELHAARRSRR